MNLKIPLYILGASITLIGLLLWVLYKKSCNDALYITHEYHQKEKILKLYIENKNTAIIENIKTLQFQLPQGYKQRETSTNDKKKIQFIVSADSISEYDPNVTIDLINEILVKIEKEFCQTASSKPMLLRETLEICLKPMSKMKSLF